MTAKLGFRTCALRMAAAGWLCASSNAPDELAEQRHAEPASEDQTALPSTPAGADTSAAPPSSPARADTRAAPSQATR
jgi:hypothetical protein